MQYKKIKYNYSSWKLCFFKTHLNP